ncbi:MAG: RluA family pseudouridine synthase [Myxococcota bacterium]|nr:RluA family pseudouridine synthase [Myxococcota bacterium]
MNISTTLTTIDVPGELDGQRLDRVLAHCLSGYSRSRIAKWVKTGRVTVDGVAVRPSTSVIAGQVITIDMPAAEPSTIVPQAMDLDVVYDDAHLIVVNKPVGLVVHPGAGHPDQTLVNGLVERFGTLSPVGAPLRPGIVHRIDAGTSGLLVVARTEQCHTHLAAQFSAHQVERVYQALAWDHGLDDTGTIETDYGRHPKDRRKFTGQLPAHRRAITHWQVLERVRPCVWTEVRLETGRTHQIRVHFSEAGQPLVGDPMYGRRRRVEHLPQLRRLGWELGLKRQALHAATLGFTHPATSEFIRFEVPPPEDLARVLDCLRAVQ